MKCVKIFVTKSDKKIEVIVIYNTVICKIVEIRNYFPEMPASRDSHKTTLRFRLK